MEKVIQHTFDSDKLVNQLDLDPNEHLDRLRRERSNGRVFQFDILVFTDGLLQKVEMPELAKSWQRGYQGHDTFRVEKGVIYRTFPIYKGSDAENQPTGGERTLKLIFEKDRWMWRLHAAK